MSMSWNKHWIKCRKTWLSALSKMLLALYLHLVCQVLETALLQQVQALQAFKVKGKLLRAAILDALSMFNADKLNDKKRSRWGFFFYVGFGDLNLLEEACVCLGS